MKKPALFDGSTEIYIPLPRPLQRLKAFHDKHKSTRLKDIHVKTKYHLFLLERKLQVHPVGKFIVPQSKLKRRILTLTLGLVIVGTGYLAYSFSTADAAWYDTGWMYRKKITIDHNKVPSTQTDFPVLISLQDSSLATNAQTSGNDIMFTSADGTTKLPHEIESYTATRSGTLVAWVKVPSLSSTTDTVLYMYYGNRSASNQQDATNVWSSSYNAVYHLKEDPSGGAPQMQESTSNNLDLTSSGSMTASQQLAGKVNGSVSFDGSNDEVYSTDNTLFTPTGDITISFWAKTDQIATTKGSDHMFIYKSHSIAPWYSYQIYQSSADNTLNFHWVNSSNTDSWNYSNSALAANTWYYITVVRSGTTGIIYINGASDTASSNTLTGSMLNSNGTFDVGGIGSKWVDGVMDEVRLSNTARSANWIATEYNNQSSPATFYTIGNQQLQKNPALFWKLDDGYGGVKAGDASEKNNYGVLGNAIWQNPAMCLFEGTCLKFEDNSTSVYFSDGFETGNTSNWSGTSAGNYSVSTENPLNGLYSIKLSPNGAAGALTKNVGSSYTSAYGHAYAYIASNPTPTQFDIMHLVNTSDSGFIIYRSDLGYMCIWNAITSTSTCSSYQQIPLDSWHKYELYVSVSATVGKIQAYFDGNLVTDLNLVNQNTGTLSLNQIEIGEWNTGRTATFYVDDVRMDNAMATYIKRDYKNDSDLDPGTSGFSVGAWFRHPTSFSGTDTIISRVDAVNGVGYKIYYNSTTGLCFGIDGTAGSFPSDAACVNTNFADNQWHYVEGVKTGTSNIKIYVDGKEGATDGSITTSSLSGSSPPFIVGADYDTVSNAWEGYIDEIRYYDYARSTSEIKADFNAKGSVLGASASFGVQNPESAIANGLVGYWKLDDGVNAPCSLGVNKACDSSGNGNTGTWTSTAASGSGKFGNGIKLNGTNGYVRAAHSSSLEPTNELSYSAWFKISNFGTCPCVIMGKNDSNLSPYYTKYLYINSSSQIIFSAYNGTNNYFTALTSLTTDTWYHVAVSAKNNDRVKIWLNGSLIHTSDPVGTLLNADTRDFMIGASLLNNTPQNYFPGTIDEVRVFNRVLTKDDVTRLYEWAPGPVAYWKMDERSGNYAFDSSGYGVTGTLQNNVKWSKGKLNGGTEYNGNDSYIDILPVSPFRNPGQAITVSGWVKVDKHKDWNNMVERDQWFWGAGYTSWKLYSDAAGNIKFGLYDGSAETGASTAISTNRWYYVTGTYDGSTIRIYLDGALKASTTKSGVNFSLTTTLNTGGSSNSITGSLDDIKIYDYARNEKQIISDMNNGHPAVGSPIASALVHLKLDDGFGNVASNSGALGSVGNGGLYNIANPATVTSGWTNEGKFDKGLVLDGSNDFVVGNLAASTITTQFTMSTWVNPNTSASQYNFFGLGATGGNRVHMNYDTGRFACEDTDASPLYVWSPTASTARNWYHVVCTYDGTTLKLYVNGKFIDSKPASISLTTNKYSLGSDLNAPAFTLPGKIDEAKIYNYALNDSEVKVEFNQGKGVVFGALSTNPDNRTASFSAARGYCPPGSTETNCSGASGVHPGPVAEWKMDERTGTTINDTSGNGFNGALFNSPLWTSAKIGSGVKFDGIDDYISVAHNAALNFPNRSPYTISFWMKSSAFNGSYEGILMKDAASRAGWEIFKEFDQNYIIMERRDSTGAYLSDCYVAFTPQVWTYVTYKYDGTTFSCYQNGILETSSTDTGNMGNPTDPLIMGAEMTDEWEGVLDDVRIYNYARSNAQIMWDYNRGKPSGWWKFDECNGRTIYDSSGNQSTGTINGDVDPGNCSTGSTYWYNGRNGKFNASYYGDGSDNFVNITPSSALNFTEQISVTAWIYADTLDSNYRRIVSRNTNPSQQWFIELDGTQPGKLYFDAGSNTYASNTTLQTGRWYHIAMIYDGSTSKLYINGKLDQSGTSTGAIGTTGNIGIGADYDGTSPWNGKIDDVRIYNFALTPAMLKTIYNNDAAVLFAPITGTP